MQKTELGAIGFISNVRLPDGSVRSTWDSTVTCFDRPMTASFDVDPRFIALRTPSLGHLILIPLSNTSYIVRKDGHE